MKFCQPHWDKLKDAIKSRGLYELVSKRGEQAAQALAEGRPDPLMAAHNAIVSNVMNVFGLAVMVQKEDGSDHCPICYAQEYVRGNPCRCGEPDCSVENSVARYEGWIDRAADEQLEHMSGKAST